MFHIFLVIENLKLLYYLYFQRNKRRAALRRISRNENGISRHLQNSGSAGKRDLRLHRRLTILTTSMTFTFYLSWTPYAVCSFFTIINHSLPHLPNVVAILMAKLGTVINPILYIYFNKEVRVLKIFKLIFFLNLTRFFFKHNYVI